MNLKNTSKCLVERSGVRHAFGGFWSELSLESLRGPCVTSHTALGKHRGLGQAFGSRKNAYGSMSRGILNCLGSLPEWLQKVDPNGRPAGLCHS